MFDQSCPRCLQTIKKSRMHSDPVVCNSCGHVLSPSQERSEEKIERSFLYAICAMAVTMTAAFMHLATWGGASVEVVRFKAADLFHANTFAQTENMARLCLEIKKFDCTEKMYARLALVDNAHYAILGKFQLNQRKFPEAAENFRRFFAGGGGDLDVNYLYARALSETGDIDEASKHFDYVLASKPGVVQVTVVQKYVKYLIGANRLDRAKQVIQETRRRDRSISSFMDAEMREILQREGRKV